jgi:hypothetical protein
MGKGIPAATRFCLPCLARRPKAVGIAGPREEDDGEMELLSLCERNDIEGETAEGRGSGVRIVWFSQLSRFGL